MTRLTFTLFFDCAMFSEYWVKNPEHLLRKISTFTSSTTRIVTDFDSTLTQENGFTSWSLIFNSQMLPQEKLEQHYLLKDTYYPHEINPSLSPKERNQYMQEWWIKSLDILVQSQINKVQLENSVIHEMKIRKGCENLLIETHRLSIPLLILSAGITQSIEAVLRENKLLFANTSITSNCLQFNDINICTGVEDTIVHVANKDEWHAPQWVKNTFKNRDKILLFWDSLDDIKMIREDERENTVAVGFCTSRRKHQKQLFLDTFDIVVEEDYSDGDICKKLLDSLAK